MLEHLDRKAVAMKRRMYVLVALLCCVGFAGGCSSDDQNASPSSAASGTTDTAKSSGSTGPSGSTRASGNTGASGSGIDCAPIKQAASALTTPQQLIAQLKSPSQWKLLKSGPVKVDVDKYLSNLEALRPLESLPKNGPKLKESLDLYTQTGNLVKGALASPDPAASEQAAQLTPLIADTANYLGHQTSIGLAVDEAKCR